MAITRPNTTTTQRIEPDGQDPNAFETLDRARPLPYRVADEILQRILSDGLQPGARLPTERELAKQFGVSRTVVREGVRALAGKGVVQVGAGQGIRVARVGMSAVQESIALFMHSRPTADYRKLHEVRTSMEVDIAGLAATRRQTDTLGLLSAELDAMERVLDDPDAVSIEDLQFHRELARCTDNEFYVIALDALVTPLLQIRRSLFGPGGRAHQALEDHRAIFERVSASDAEGARDAMRRHLADIEADWERTSTADTARVLDH